MEGVSKAEERVTRNAEWSWIQAQTWLLLSPSLILFLNTEIAVILKPRTLFPAMWQTIYPDGNNYMFDEI